MTAGYQQLRNLLSSSEADQGFALLYGTKAVNSQKQRYLKLLDQADSVHSNASPVFISAPGRTELGGNHTDHNSGRVLAAAVNLDCVGLVARSDDKTINLRTPTLPGEIAVELSSLQPVESEKGTAAALLRGVASAIHKQSEPMGGFSGLLDSTCPFGAGLSSSAAFSVFAGAAISLLHGGAIADPVDLAKHAQRAENNHFGKPCGLMDQLASAVGGTVFIDFSSQENPKVEKINCALQRSGYQLAVVDTGGSHAELTEEYAAIPSEMKKAAAALGKEDGRQVSREDLLAGIAAVRSAAGDRALLRLLHFIAEDQRTADQAAALKDADFRRFMELVKESGRSSLELLQNCSTATSTREQGILLGIALSRQFCAGSVCRVHGGGFAGTIQSYIPISLFAEYKRRMEEVFGAGSVIPLRTGRPGVCALTADGWVYPAEEREKPCVT